MKRIASAVIALLGALNDCVTTDVVYPRTVRIAAVTTISVEVITDLTSLWTGHTIAAGRARTRCCAIFIAAAAGIGVAIITELALNTVLTITTDRRDPRPRAICIAATTVIGKPIVTGFKLKATLAIAAGSSRACSGTIRIAGSTCIGETIVTDLKERLQDTVTTGTVTLTNG
jgi:hypothetical protein